MSDETTLVPVQERRINFDGDEILAVLIERENTREVYVPIRQLCDFLGLDWSAQRQRMLRDEVLTEDMTSVVITPTLVSNQRYKQSYTVICLPLEDLPGWLFGVSPSRVRPEFREKVKLYRRKCYRVLWQAFAADLLSVEAEVVPQNSAVPASDGHLALVEEQYDHLLGVTNLVREHLEILTGVITPVADKLDYAVLLLETLVGRQDETESKLAQIDQRTQRLTPEHARAVAELVEQMVHRTAKSPVPLDHYKIYGRIKHHFRTNSYKEVADERFSEVMTYLRELLLQALDGELPRQESLF